MTEQESEQLVKNIFDTIFSSVTSAAPGGVPAMTASTTMLSLVRPGIAVNAADFRNPWSPGNLDGDKDAAINTARLVDIIPTLSSLYSDSGKTVTEIYKQILDGVSIPAQNPDSGIARQLKAADALLFRDVDVMDPDTGERQVRRLETPLYRDYLNNQSAYFMARTSYTAAYLASQETASGRASWPLVAGTLELPVRQAYDRWRSGGADRVEQAIAIINTSAENALQVAFDNAKKTFVGYGVNLEESGTGMSTPILRSSILPSNWYSTEATGWTSYDSTSAKSSTTMSSDFKTYGASVGFSVGLFGLGASGGATKSNQRVSSETSNLQVSFKYSLASIRRSWLTFNLLGTKGWSLGNLYAKGEVSQGSKLAQDMPAAFPLLPTAFVIVKDVKISANWSKSDLELITKQTRGGGGFSIGVFSLSGSYVRSRAKQTFTSAISGNTIEVPGVQIIGVVSQVVPLSPPT